MVHSCEGRRARRRFDNAFLVVQNRWTPRGFLRGRICRKDRGGIKFRTRTPPRDGSVHFGSLNDIGLLRLASITLNVHPKFPGATSNVPFKYDIIGVKFVDPLDALLHLGYSETTSPVDIQNADQQRVDLVGDRQDCGKEMGGVLEVGAKSRVAEGSRLPRVTTSEKIEENDAEGPDIVEQGRI